MSRSTHTQLRGDAAHGRTAYIKRPRSNTGVSGVSYQVARDKSGKLYRRFFVTPHYRHFNIETLGHAEAWRRALALRAAHEAAILPRQLENPECRLRVPGTNYPPSPLKRRIHRKKEVAHGC